MPTNAIGYTPTRTVCPRAENAGYGEKSSTPGRLCGNVEYSNLAKLIVTSVENLMCSAQFP